MASPNPLIAVLFIIQGINLIWPILPAWLLGLTLLAGGGYILYKFRGELAA